MVNNLLYGTHNSGTSSSLVWWLRPFGYLLNLTSRCQSRSIDEQLEDGVVLFNFQVCYYKDDWHFSHGLCIYDGLLFDAIRDIIIHLHNCKDNNKKIYIQLSLDKNFLVGQNIDRYKELVEYIINDLHNERLVILWCVIEGSGEYLYFNKSHGLSYNEKYWLNGFNIEGYKKSLLDYLPLPKYHAKKFNNRYVSECKQSVLMLDYYEVR